MALAKTDDMPMDIPSVSDIRAAVTGKVNPNAANGIEPRELM
jgi:hypothetical protein